MQYSKMTKKSLAQGQSWLSIKSFENQQLKNLGLILPLNLDNILLIVSLTLQMTSVVYILCLILSNKFNQNSEKSLLKPL